ncbi:MAG: hypothetical protein INQ03_09395 [Candidatus Heimdallarchaeota archaeon]|nr:hypothetical protein [Candidatus Heimdallarchaeota archaeon]
MISKQSVNISRKKYILALLNKLPSRYNIVRKYIIAKDLEILISDVENNYSNIIDRKIVALILHRCTFLRVSSNPRDLFICLGREYHKKKFLKFYNEWIHSGLFKPLNRQYSISCKLNSAENVLNSMYSQGMFDKTIISASIDLLNLIPIKYPDSLKGTFDMDIVLAFLSLRLLLPDLNVRETLRKYSKFTTWNEKQITLKYNSICRLSSRDQAYYYDLQNKTMAL